MTERNNKKNKKKQWLKENEWKYEKLMREKWLRWLQNINNIIDNKNLEIININFRTKEREISKNNAKWEKGRR